MVVALASSGVCPSHHPSRGGDSLALHPTPAPHLFVFLDLARGQGLHRRAPIIMAGTEGMGGLKTGVLPRGLRIQPEYFPWSTWCEVPRGGSQGPTAVLGSQPRALHLLLRSRAPWRPVLGPRQRAEVSLPAVSVSLKPERLGPRRKRDLSTLPNPCGARTLIFLELQSPLQNQHLGPHPHSHPHPPHPAPIYC